ncbi:MAG: helix-turn-helix transcriptional regulator [Clostridia bacterium]|nr:helix-turn-helix transcriptional regulator [Clostridia bacterium]
MGFIFDKSQPMLSAWWIKTACTASGEDSITDADHSGFNDIAYFSREFKKITGVSPQDAIKSNKTYRTG